MSTQLYAKQAYHGWRERSLASAREVVPIVVDLVKPRSVIDVGCGLGMWASVFKEYGVEKVRGVDNLTVPIESLLIPREEFIQADLGQPLSLDDRFDMVISLEVAEHLPPDRAGTFIDTLTSLGPVVVFSAAIPHQRGHGHINEQWPEYWARLFARRGYRAVDCVRRRVWDNAVLEPYYKQNTVVYVDATALDRYPALAGDVLAEDELPLSLIHPYYYLRRTDFANSSVKWYAQTVAHYFRAVLRRVGLAPKTV